jgi:hypothetical protein
MRNRGFDHTPNGLPSVAEDTQGLTSRGLFRNVFSTKKPQQLAVKPAAAAQSVPASPNYIRVSLEDSLSGFKKFVEKSKLLRLANGGDTDLALKKQGEKIILVSAAGDMVTSLDRPNNADLVNALEQQSRIHKMLNDNARQDFNVFLDIQGSGKGSAFVKGEKLGFTIKSDRPSYILMVGIDSMGNMNVLYPYQPSELAPIAAEKPFVQRDMIEVGKPYGRDYIQVYAFDKKPKELPKLVASELSADAAGMKLFKHMLANKSLKKAHASVELITTDR